MPEKAKDACRLSRSAAEGLTTHLKAAELALTRLGVAVSTYKRARSTLKRLTIDCKTMLETMKEMEIDYPGDEHLMRELTNAAAAASAMDEQERTASAMLPRSNPNAERGECTICLRIIRAETNHVNLECGHCFCLSCFEGLFYDGRGNCKSCPNCRRRIPLSSVVD